jgi:hypothetical protein
MGKISMRAERTHPQAGRKPDFSGVLEKGREV